MKFYLFKGKYFYLPFLLCLLFSQQNSYSQLTGPKSIPGNYATIEAAIADLNAVGVGPGGVIFNVAAGHTETFTVPTAGRILVSGTAANTIVFQKSGAGANPLITAALNGTGIYDGIIVLGGTDYITFDGISLQENSGNATDTTRMEWGYALLKKNADCSKRRMSVCDHKKCHYYNGESKSSINRYLFNSQGL